MPETPQKVSERMERILSCEHDFKDGTWQKDIDLGVKSEYRDQTCRICNWVTREFRTV